MIEMLKASGDYPAFVAYVIGAAIGLGMIALGLFVKFTND